MKKLLILIALVAVAAIGIWLYQTGKFTPSASDDLMLQTEMTLEQEVDDIEVQSMDEEFKALDADINSL